jgi:predicted AlkP superfamily pyrophosphatase or phosphodiesterase
LKRIAVLNVVGLCESLLGEHTPLINSFLANHSKALIEPAFPAVTCTAQSNYLTGQPPAMHGAVANGWYNRELAEVQFWKQSNHLITAPKIWDDLRAQYGPEFTCAKLFWWYNMYATVDFSITPRPMYPADGRKVFDIYTHPFDLGPKVKADLGEFPFPAFWGPAAGVDSEQFSADAVSKWIAASARWVEEKHSPTLSLIYLPHLDYNLQRKGPRDPSVGKDLREIDAIVGGLLGFFEARDVEPIIVSEYGITPVDRPVHLNRIFRRQNWLAIKTELGLELLDAGASKVFAVADHQIAHIYVNEPSLMQPVREILEGIDGVETVLGPKEKSAAGISHYRAGDLIVIARERSWFTYYYWLDDALAPDFARCVDIHRKPGYDPVELFIDPNITLPKLKIVGKLLKKKLGFRMLMDLIPLDASLIKGSHGRRPESLEDYPLIIGRPGLFNSRPQLRSTEVYGCISRAVSGL